MGAAARWDAPAQKSSRAGLACLQGGCSPPPPPALWQQQHVLAIATATAAAAASLSSCTRPPQCSTLSPLSHARKCTNLAYETEALSMQQKSSHRGGHPVREIAESLGAECAREGRDEVSASAGSRATPASSSKAICVHLCMCMCMCMRASMQRVHTCVHARMRAVCACDPPHAHMASRAITPPACHSSFLPTITMLRELSVPCASSHSTARRPGSAPRPHPHPRAATARPGGRAARPGGRAHAMAPTSTVSVVTNSPGLPKTMPRRQGRQRACTRGEGVTSLPPDLLQQIFVRLRPAGICAIARA
jgi:hypothetical protein